MINEPSGLKVLSLHHLEQRRKIKLKDPEQLSVKPNKQNSQESWAWLPEGETILRLWKEAGLIPLRK
jgi:hypothetical protein